MAYTPANLTLVTEGPLTGGGQQWNHFSADTGAVAQVAGFISDGFFRGLKVNDVVFHRNTATNIVTTHLVLSANSSTGAVDLSDATTFVSGTNSN